MKGASQSFEAAGVQSKARNVSSFSGPFDRRQLAIGLWVFAGYYVGAKIGFALTFKPHPVSVLWPPNSILVAALLLTPPRIWWFVLLAAFPAHCAAELQSDVPPLMIVCWFISNSFEAVIGAGLTRYLVGGPIRFNSLRNAAIFCLCVVFAGPFLSSFLDAAFVRWNVWGQSSYWELIRIRFFSNVLAALIVVPLIVTWATSGILALRTAGRARLLEACLLLSGLLSISFVVFYKFGPQADSALLFLTLPFLLWAAARFGSLGASTALSILGFLAIWSASHGHGPFSGGTAEQNALSIQTFLIALSIPMLFLAAVIEEQASGQTELRESEHRFRIVADAAPVLIWMAGVDKLCTFFNKPWLEFTGRSLEQEMGNGWLEGVHPDDLQSCLKTYVEAFDARKPFVMQYQLRRHDGEYRWISDGGVPRYDAHGNFAGYIGSCTDVTELINKEQALREFEERVVLAAQAAHLGVWEWHTSQNEIWMSDSARGLFRLDSETRLDHATIQDRIHPDDRVLRDSAVKSAIETQGEYEVEYRVSLPDRTLRWIGERGRCEAGKNEKRTRLIGVSIDITERKQAEEKFRLAVEASPSGILLVDSEGRIVLVNTHVEELFGYRREELVGKLVDILVPERFAGKHAGHRAQFLAAPAARVMGAGRELFARRRDGSEFPIEIGLNPIELPDGMLVLASVVDTSARKRAELEAVQHREELGHLSRVAAMGELAASIAHELNQPLSGITSNASAGQRFIDRGDMDLRELRELLGDIIADGRRAGDVIRGIQSMVKKDISARQQVNLNDLVMGVVRIVKPNAMLQSCELDTLLEPKLPTIEADPIQLQQVLLNLIINALDAMRDTPVSRRKVVIATERNGDGTICTSVRDYGSGIPEEVRERMFEQFFTTKGKGLGMGLAIVRSIIKSHGGTIAAENADGGGARFHFTLPAKSAGLSE
jgi:PAS domain S-box-containing protein